MSTQPDPESIRIAMEQAWRDHQHTRDQTWKALQIEFALAVAIVGATWPLGNAVATAIAALLVLVIGLCGVQITLRHRNSVEITKFRHIMNCEEALGLRGLIDGVKPPGPITLSDAFRPRKGNTAIFILRMQLAILFFAPCLLIWGLLTR